MTDNSFLSSSSPEDCQVALHCVLILTLADQSSHSLVILLNNLQHQLQLDQSRLLKHLQTLQQMLNDYNYYNVKLKHIES